MLELFLIATLVTLFKHRILSAQNSLTCLTSVSDKARWTAEVKAIYFILTGSIVETGAALTLVDFC